MTTARPAGLFLFALLCLSTTAAAQQAKPGPNITRRVTAQRTPDARLEAAIRKYLGVSEEEAASLRYSYNRVDLSGDGKPEVLVYVTGSAVCGSGGCTLLVMRELDGNYEGVTQITLARTPIIVSLKQTKGWRHLIMPVSGGGTTPGYAELAFNGKQYPDNPTVAPARRLQQSGGGTAYLSGADASSAGLPLQPRLNKPVK